ncbi:Glycosyltransferase involved in cell wall bisynthesis [Paenibacillus sp. RU4T]|uniref:glycosyltransferase n=1 Tax=unclassified Paenibacillus TaxID=185978 RepID=UPI00095646D9|nr:MULTISPECIES: glycosyltransferase [unclassified Paenibacillus]SIQ81196.1 Glycosyltransferase involved in cell wall bisynthesis [Paenibacillus sp. RU4X]SIR02633.1 Glycosyltransferase involved in cell wall bisynthesis [Paenibacillus sp. RU4T]
MNIAIDVLAILGKGSKNRGIGNYTTSQLKKMFELDKENNYYLINFYEEKNLKELLSFSSNVKELYFYTSDINQIRNEENFKIVLKDIIQKIILDYSIDVFYVTSPFDGTMIYEHEWFKGTKTVVTLYDIIPYIFQGKYLTDKFFKNEYMKCLEELTKYDKILSISQSAKDDLITHFNVDEETVDVIYAGVDEKFQVLNSMELEAAKKELETIYGIRSEFIMCTGGVDDRKNIGELILAYSALPKNLIERFQLVIACKLSDISEKRYYDMAEKNKVKGRVILTNFVPDHHLVQLYNLAYAVAFPSKYEGFGLPVVEAMACETPVLTSNNSSLGEIADGAAILVDPFNTKDITRGLQELLEMRSVQDLVEKGSERVKQFSWEAVSKRTLDVIKSMNNENKPVKQHRKQLAIFTPLPPIQSGISDYSFDLINVLAEDFDISVFIDDTYTAEEFAHSQIKIYPHHEFKSIAKRFDEIIYQMGNSDYHAYMLNYIKAYKGLLVLHDYNIHGLLDLISSNEQSLNQYKEYLLEDYDSELVSKYIADVKSGRNTRKIHELPLNGVITNYAKKIIVHSEYSQNKLLNKNLNLKIKKINHYAINSPLVEKSRAKENIGIPSNQFVIASFGHIHETKRTLPLIEAFKELAATNENLYLYLVGKPAPEIQKPIEALLNDSLIKERVIITGYTSLEEYEGYMDAADLCVNLRYPYNGETSGSLMRILSKGKCSLISSIGSFEEVPDHCCVKIDSAEHLTKHCEVSEIQNKLGYLIENPEAVKEIERNARTYSENFLDIRQISRQYKEYILNPYESHLTENVLRGIIEYINRNNWNSQINLYKLAQTIAYSKSY